VRRPTRVSGPQSFLGVSISLDSILPIQGDDDATAGELSRSRRLVAEPARFESGFHSRADRVGQMLAGWRESSRRIA
jgi:hypothetical protein